MRDVVCGMWQLDPPLRRMANSYMYMISTNARYRFETYKEKTNENQASSSWLAGTTSQSVMKENQSGEQAKSEEQQKKKTARNVVKRSKAKSELN